MSRPCIDCGLMIPKDRLKIVPTPQRCVACQSTHEQLHEFRQFVDEGLSGSRTDNKKLRENIADAIRKRPWE